MEPTTEEHMTSDARVGFRDIYRAVGESEARILARIDAAFAAQVATTSDHEQRLRALESGTGGAPAKLQGDIDSIRLDVVALKAESMTNRAIGERRGRDASIFNRLILTVVIVSNFILGLIVMFANLIAAK